MTKPLFVFAFALFVVAGCHRSLRPYHNLNKWMIPQGNDRRPLAGQPKAVTEYTFAAADTADPAKRKVLFVKYGFNAGGDLDSTDTYVNDSLVMRSVNHFDANGLQQTVTNVKTGQSVQTITVREPDGRYKTTANHAKSAPSIAYSSFTGDDQVEVEQGEGQPGPKGEGPGGVHVFYEGYRINKVTGVSATGNLEERFFYSRWDSPDSVSIYTGSKDDMKLVEREIFENNDHGDPVRHLQLVGHDTLSAQVFSYTYDQRGNWIRKISNPVRGAVPMSLERNVPMVTERVITY